jgi:hypothetical protein
MKKDDFIEKNIEEIEGIGCSGNCAYDHQCDSDIPGDAICRENLGIIWEETEAERESQEYLVGLMKMAARVDEVLGDPKWWDKKGVLAAATYIKTGEDVDGN